MLMMDLYILERIIMEGMIILFQRKKKVLEPLFFIKFDSKKSLCFKRLRRKSQEFLLKLIRSSF